MKLELEFATGDDLINFLASLTATGRKYVGLTEKTATSAAREVNAPPATVTPEKQEAARKSTGKVKDTPPAEPVTTPETALVQGLTYEADLGPLFARTVVHDKDAALAALGGRNAFEIPKDEWPTLMSALEAILKSPVEAAAAPLDYERDVVPKIKAAQGKDKTALAAVLLAHGGKDPETGKPSGRFVPADNLADLSKALDAIAGA